MKNANNILFRCSSLGHLMTEPKNKNEPLSETTKTNLIDIFVSANYNRREETESKFIEKGNAREEDSITLLSRVKKLMLKKNDVRLSNEFITGEMDIFLGKDINDADETFDIKTSWSAFTFFRAQKELNKMYFWQGQGYMALTGAKKHTVAYCLVNGTAQAIDDEKRRLSYKMNLLDPSNSEEYSIRCRKIEINHIFDLKSFIKENPFYEFHSDIKKWEYDISPSERVFTFEFERDEFLIKNLYDRIIQCRSWMNKNLYKTIPEPGELTQIEFN